MIGSDGNAKEAQMEHFKGDTSTYNTDYECMNFQSGCATNSNGYVNQTLKEVSYLGTTGCQWNPTKCSNFNTQVIYENNFAIKISSADRITTYYYTEWKNNSCQNLSYSDLTGISMILIQHVNKECQIVSTTVLDLQTDRAIVQYSNWVKIDLHQMPINVGMIKMQKRHPLTGVDCVLITLYSQQMKNVHTFEKNAELMVKDALKIQNYALTIRKHKHSAINSQDSFQIVQIDNSVTTQLKPPLLLILLSKNVQLDQLKIHIVPNFQKAAFGII